MTEFNAALNQVATERGISVDSVLESVRQALATAYRKDRKEHGVDVDLDEIVVELDSDTGEVRILKDGKDVTPAGFGRIAAQTAKQVILQKIRETEKETIASEYRAKIGEIVNGIVFRVENSIVTLDLGKTHAHGIMLQSDQVPTESYRMNQRLKVLIRDVRDSTRGTEILVSRSSPDFVKKLFEQEVPEIATGVVKIEAIAREAGSRTKMAVSSSDEKVDPVGSCVGQKGVRVQSIISELFGEKIDIVPYSPITEKFIAASLSPARVAEVELEKEEKRAIVTVPEDQQSLAIGKEGQNARLANKLTKWKIDIKGSTGVFVTGEETSEVSSEGQQVVGVWDAEIQRSRERTKDQDSEQSDSSGENPEEEDEGKAVDDMETVAVSGDGDVSEDTSSESAQEDIPEKEK
ncbi:transcription termination/antitermination protein NusA [Patescibacteria group bacterium]|nr:transcription termination/antitermination protein NusA [Patescibacteria group bacterium]